MTNTSNQLFLYKSKLFEIDNSIETQSNLLDSKLKELNRLDSTSKFFQAYIVSQTESTKLFMETLINRGLEYVYGHVYKVEFKDEPYGNKINKRLELTNLIDNVTGDEESHGGGVFAVMSFMIKFVISLKSNLLPIMVLDESFKHVSREYQERLSQFLKELCKEFGYTIFLISHEENIDTSADQIFVLSKVKGQTVVEKK